jgi:hypothetical protein
MEWIFVLCFCALVAAGARSLCKVSNLAAIIWTAVWGIVFAVVFWPF